MAKADSTVTYKDIPDFPGYRVGDDGSVWSAREVKRKPTGYGSYSVIGNSWRKLKPATSRRNGRPVHCAVVLMREGGRHNLRVHTLVLTAFVGPCPAGLECCHGDGDPTNNKLTNLRWDTPHSNVADCIRHGRKPRGEGQHLAKLTAEQVRLIRLEHAAGNITQRQLGTKFGVNDATINNVIKGRTWKHVTPHPDDQDSN